MAHGRSMTTYRHPLGQACGGVDLRPAVMSTCPIPVDQDSITRPIDHGRVNNLLSELFVPGSRDGLSGASGPLVRSSDITDTAERERVLLGSTPTPREYLERLTVPRTLQYPPANGPRFDADRLSAASVKTVALPDSRHNIMIDRIHPGRRRHVT